jgi:Ice-binding-like
MMDGNRVQVRPVEERRARRWTAAVALAAVAGTVLLVGVLAVPAGAAEAPVGLGTAGSYSVLGGQTVTNTGPTKLSGDLGVSPGTAITGFPPGTVGGAKHAGDAQAAKAQSDLTIAYNDAAGRALTASVAGDLVGKTLTAGVYKSTGPLALSGTVTLNGQGNPDAVFIFQVASTLITASASHVKVINGAQACHVFWQVGSSATLGTTSSFKGTIMALTSIAVQTGALVQGRALARNGAVTLDNDTFTAANCGTTPTPTSSASASSSSPFTPGPGLSGDHAPGGGPPLKKILLGVALAVLGVAVAMSVQPPRRRGNHS